MIGMKQFNPRSDALKARDEPGQGDDVPCQKCGAVALDTGLECGECGHDNWQALNGEPFRKGEERVMNDATIHRLMTQSGCGGTLTPAVHRFALACAELGMATERERCAELCDQEHLKLATMAQEGRMEGMIAGDGMRVAGHIKRAILLGLTSAEP